jgi:hypothetical protein
MPTGVPRSNYTGPLAKALGFRRPQQLRDILKAGGIFPYTDKERASLELLVQKGHRDRLKKYRPLAQDAQVYFDQAIAQGASPPATPASASSGQLTLMPAPSAPPQTKTAVTAWDQKLTPRLARLLARSYPDMEFEALKRMARKIMRDAGMEARSEDEAQALAAFRAAGHSIEGFEYQNALPVAADEPTIETAQLPADLEKLSPQQLRLEVVKLRERLHASGMARHQLAKQKARAQHFLENAEVMWWADRAKLFRDNPNIRPPTTSEADHLWQMANLELKRDYSEDT